MKAEVSSPLAATICALLLALIGLVCDTRRTALRTDNGPALQQLLAEGGFVPSAAHEEVLARVARQDVVIAELAKNSTEMGAALRESRKSAEGFATRLLAVEGALEQQGDGGGGEGARRRTAEGAEEPEPEPVQGEYVLQIKVNTSKLCRPGCGCTGGMDAAGNFDMSKCCDPGWNACYPQECAGANCLHGDGKGVCPDGAAVASQRPKLMHFLHTDRLSVRGLWARNSAFFHIVPQCKCSSPPFDFRKSSKESCAQMATTSTCATSGSRPQPRLSPGRAPIGSGRATIPTA